MSDSPEREQISRELAEELGYEIDERGTWYTYVFQSTIPTYLAKPISDALISQKLRIKELETDNGYLKQLLKCDPDETIEDGFGSTWSRTCPTCGLGTMHVNRPGEVQCDYCE